MTSEEVTLELGAKLTDGPGRLFLSFSQFQEDFRAFAGLDCQSGGSYVDVGSNDPILDSNTFGLYLRGWRGIAVEPQERYRARHSAIRPCDHLIDAAAWSFDGSVQLTVPRGTAFGWAKTGEHIPEQDQWDLTKNGRFLVRARTMKSIAEECSLGQVDFLSVDVEGSTREVMMGWDWERVPPRLVCVEKSEYTNWSLATHRENVQDWQHILDDAGYRFCLDDGINRWYAHRDGQVRVDLLVTPEESGYVAVGRAEEYLVPRNPRVESALRAARRIRSEMVALKQGARSASRSAGRFVRQWQHYGSA